VDWKKGGKPMLQFMSMSPPGPNAAGEQGTSTCQVGKQQTLCGQILLMCPDFGGSKSKGIEQLCCTLLRNG